MRTTSSLVNVASPRSTGIRRTSVSGAWPCCPSAFQAGTPRMPAALQRCQLRPLAGLTGIGGGIRARCGPGRITQSGGCQGRGLRDTLGCGGMHVRSSSRVPGAAVAPGLRRKGDVTRSASASMGKGTGIGAAVALVTPIATRQAGLEGGMAAVGVLAPVPKPASWLASSPIWAGPQRLMRSPTRLSRKPARPPRQTSPSKHAPLRGAPVARRSPAASDAGLGEACGGAQGGRLSVGSCLRRKCVQGQAAGAA